MVSGLLERVLVLLRRRETEAPVSSIEEGRARLEAFSTLIDPIPGVRLASARVGGVPCEWVTAPRIQKAGVLLYLHGGGYALGSFTTHRALVSRLSRATRLRALTVGYRLAPEHPFPAALDDALAVYRSLVDGGVAPTRIVVAGDSAGGGLALAMILALRDAGQPLPAAGVCLSPWVDLDVAHGAAPSSAQRDPMIKPHELRIMASLYLAGANPRSPLASPLHAVLHALPPLLVQVGAAEALLDDSLRLADRVRDAGGDVTLEQWPDMMHVWHAFAPLLPDADRAIARIGAWTRERVATDATRRRAERSASAAAAVGAATS